MGYFKFKWLKLKKNTNTFSDCSNMKVRVENIYNQNSSYFKNVRIISLDYTILYFFYFNFFRK